MAGLFYVAMVQEALPDRSARLDTLFEALGDEHRLRVLVSLYTADPGEQFWAEDLVRPGEDVETVHSALYHRHFPKLEALELVEWDREENAVSRGPRFSAVDQLLDCLVVGDDVIQAGLLSHEM